jgi:hypothetical protein
VAGISELYTILKYQLVKAQIFLFFLFIGSNTNGQTSIESFPKLTNFIIVKFANSNNIFPIAFIEVKIENQNYKIPISYSFLTHRIDNKHFLHKDDNIDNYCFKVLEKGICKPLFKKEALILPPNERHLLITTRRRYDSIRTKINLKDYIEFTNEPEWWQNDQTPIDEKGKPLTFICQIGLIDIFDDDCKMFVFFDSKRKIVRQIYQR